MPVAPACMLADPCSFAQCCCPGKDSPSENRSHNTAGQKLGGQKLSDGKENYRSVADSFRGSPGGSAQNKGSEQTEAEKEEMRKLCGDAAAKRAQDGKLRGVKDKKKC